MPDWLYCVQSVVIYIEGLFQEVAKFEILLKESGIGYS